MLLLQVFPFIASACLFTSGVKHSELLDDMRNARLVQYFIVAFRANVLGLRWLEAANEVLFGKESV